MALNWDRFQKFQRENPIPKFALDKASKNLKKNPKDPYLLTWKASALLKLSGRANEAQTILTGLSQLQPPITDLQLLSFIYSSVLDAIRQQHPGALAQVSVGTEALKAWQNAAKALSRRKAKLDLWSALFVAAMKEECWEDAKLATVQANKEGVESTFKKSMYYSRILASQLGAEQKIEIAKKANHDDPGSQIQLTVTLRQMQEAYGSSLKPTDEILQVSTMSDLHFMAAIYERQGRGKELLQLWADPPPAVKKIIDGAYWDFQKLKLKVAVDQGEWQLVNSTCSGLLDIVHSAGNPTDGDPSKARDNMFSVCTIYWTVWKNLMDAATHLYPGEEGSKKLWNLFKGISDTLPPRDKTTYRAFGLTRLSVEAYCGTPSLDSVFGFYCDCYRNPNCFRDLRRFVALLTPEDQRKFHGKISKHAQILGSRLKKEDASEDQVKVQEYTREWHQTEMTVLKFELLMIASLVTDPDVGVLEDFVQNALRLWGFQLDAEGTEDMCDSDSLLVALEALIRLFEITFHPKYLYQAATLMRYSLALDKQRRGKSMALLSTRLHLRLGLGSFAFEHYNHVQVKEMLHDNVAWVALARISQSHPHGATGSRSFSPDGELKKVITTIQRMEDKIDDLLYTDMQRFIYDKAFDLIELKQRLRTSLTKQFCIVERRRIARLTGVIVEPFPDLSLREHEDISDNCHWDAIPGFNHTISGAFGDYDFVRPVTKYSIYHFRTITDIVNGILFNETQGLAHFKSMPFARKYMKLHEAAEAEGSDEQKFFTFCEYRLIQRYWNPIACILHMVHPKEELAVIPLGSLEDVLNALFKELENDEKYFRQGCLDATDTSFERMPHLTEDVLNIMYGRLEIYRVLNRLVDYLRPISKQHNHPLHKHFDVSVCDRLAGFVKEIYRLQRLYVQAIIDRLSRTGVAHIRAQIFAGPTGAMIGELIADETLDWYSKEYCDSAIEALKGILKVQLV
ncbi:hypothetical protein BU23DRAFT_603998 [Bimuria novae-zelandiae CBS 107.79]|uniref:Uncharacterized protein n=1 Tax=Bimuria novae-zelandiae CBS 107.79 TaxID=1447943 RepID=A0A6A5UM21_9PLEO|nr:hypothetical protein BU23DRAFT_603998 [Bimuria novae-zelandiae CBS 107.79]